MFSSDLKSHSSGATLKLFLLHFWCVVQLNINRNHNKDEIVSIKIISISIAEFFAASLSLLMLFMKFFSMFITIAYV